MSDEKKLNVLLAVDGSPHSEAAVTLTAGMKWPADTFIHALSVVPEMKWFADLSAEAQQTVSETLAEARQIEWVAAERITVQATQKLAEHGLLAQAETCGGPPSTTILQQATRLFTDLVVIGARGWSAPAEFHLGSTAHKVAHYADCSVLIARPPVRALPLSIILAVDGSPEAQRAADFLCCLSWPHWAEITVCSVAEFKVNLGAGERRPMAQMSDIVRRMMLDMAEEHTSKIVEQMKGCSAQVQRSIRLGHPAGEILAVAQEQDADLIVIGARGQTRAEPFRVGGVAQKVVKYASHSVLLVR
jgi:nucleotide-binding universal stress UspA family protein